MYKGIYVYSHRQNYGNEQGSSGAVSQKGSERSDEIAFDLWDRSRPVKVQNHKKNKDKTNVHKSL